MKGFDDTSEGIFEQIFTSPLLSINYRFLLTKTRSQTTLDANNKFHFEKIRRLILLVELLVNIQKLIIPARKNWSIHYKWIKNEY